MIDINHARDFVAKSYPGDRWKKKVKKMSDAQVLAIYMREIEKDQKPMSKKKEDTNGPDIPF